jgi:rhamnulokinase
MTEPAHSPADPRALVAIDLGAESCRVSLLRWIDDRPSIYLVHRFPNAPRQTPRGLCWDLALIESGLNEGLRRAAELAPEGIRSLAVDGWAVDYVRMDDSGEAVADPFCYRDERTLAAEQTLHARISVERMREITGVGILRINTLYQQFADTPELKQLRWLNLPEYILHRLGGRPVAEFTNATHSQMIDLATGRWSHEIAAAAALDPALYPELVEPGTQLGRLTGPLAELPAYSDTLLIAPAAHDTASALAGIPAHGDDWAYISSGTWSLVGTLLNHPCNDAATYTDNFTNLGAACGLTCFHKNVNGMWLLRQSMEFWAAAGRRWETTDLVAAAERLPAPESLIDVNEPDLLLPSEMPRRINMQLRRRGLAEIAEDDAPAIANLIFHSLAACYAQVLWRIAQHSGKRLSRLFIVGGGSQNLYLNRLTAEATGLEVIRGPQESSTIGNFAVQLARLESQAKAKLDAERICAWAAALQDAAL